jgi:hypothetical protein
VRMNTHTKRMKHKALQPSANQSINHELDSILYLEAHHAKRTVREIGDCPLPGTHTGLAETVRLWSPQESSTTGSESLGYVSSDVGVLCVRQRFSFWRKSHGTLKAGWSISGGKGCHLLQKEVFRQKEKRWCERDAKDHE